MQKNYSQLLNQFMSVLILGFSNACLKCFILTLYSRATLQAGEGELQGQYIMLSNIVHMQTKPEGRFHITVLVIRCLFLYGVCCYEMLMVWQGP